MSNSSVATVALPIGHEGEFEEVPMYAEPVEVTDADLAAMTARRQAAGVSLAEANRVRAEHGLPPLGRIAQSREHVMYRVPSWR